MMMLIDGAPRLSLTSQRRKRALNNNNSTNTNTKNRQSKRLPNSRQKPKKVKKRVCFDMINKTCVVNIPKVNQEDADYLWHSNMDYSFFVLNWKYYPQEPMEPRSFLDTLWQVKNTPETMRMEDYQCFQPQDQIKRQRIRDAILRQAYCTPPRRDATELIAPLSMSLTAEHKRQAQVCAALNEQEVRAYLYPSGGPATRDEIMPSPQEQQQGAMSFLSDYVDSILHRTAAFWPTQI